MTLTRSCRMTWEKGHLLCPRCSSVGASSTGVGHVVGAGCLAHVLRVEGHRDLARPSGRRRVRTRCAKAIWCDSNTVLRAPVSWCHSATATTQSLLTYRDLGSRSICTAYSASASPSDASDDASDEAAKNDVNVVGCCAVTKQNFKGGAKVMRGPDWKWSDQDGGPGKLSKVRI